MRQVLDDLSLQLLGINLAELVLDLLLVVGFHSLSFLCPLSDQLPFFLVAQHHLHLELLDLLLKSGVTCLQVHTLFLHF